MSSSSGHWEFSYKNIEFPMNIKDLEAYQCKLLELRHRYTDKLTELDGCEFYEKILPPPDNIFASFHFECRRHNPRCKGWYLLWNPNIDVNMDKAKSSLHNHCTTWLYKTLSKKIQLELMKKFDSYFYFFDDDDTHEYFLDSYYDLKYGFNTEEDELPDYASSHLTDSLNIH
jgi:hypothetical protein